MDSGVLPAHARFYRRWSCWAAELALTADEPRIRQRCTHSAQMWALIAETIEAGDDEGLARLTRNLLYLAPVHMKAEA